MAKRREEDLTKDLAAVVDFVRQRTDGARSGEIAVALKKAPQRTLQRWLRTLVEQRRLTREGKGSAERYRIPTPAEQGREADGQRAGLEGEGAEEVDIALSAESQKIREYLRQSSAARKAVGYKRQFLDS